MMNNETLRGDSRLFPLMFLVVLLSALQRQLDRFCFLLGLK